MKLSLQVDILVTTRDSFWILADVVIVDPTCSKYAVIGVVV
jgi:hypothetical protein